MANKTEWTAERVARAVTTDGGFWPQGRAEHAATRAAARRGLVKLTTDEAHDGRRVVVAVPA